ncbi:MAG TPA: AAA family ATPase [Candidatus Nanopelagicales bacterium]|jgi:DNA-binding CsgD family transcriptional regulator
MGTRGRPIVARESELELVHRFIGDIRVGPASLTIEGHAGIGKTSIWEQSLSQARTAGVMVRECRCSQSDATLAFAGLGDLFDNLYPAVLDRLPDVQRSALSAALLLSDLEGQQAGVRVVGVAVLGVLRELAGSAPLLLAVDDVQWLDTSSGKALSYALRRLDDEAVRLVTSWRTGVSSEVAPDLGVAGERLVVGPVSVGAMARIVQVHLKHPLARPTLTRLHRATGGNPMMCVEMARALERRGAEPSVSEPLPVPADFRLLVTERLHGLSASTRDLLLVTGALAQPTVTAVADAVGDPTRAARCLEEAVAAGIVEVDGERVRFTHPLIASIPYEDLTVESRLALHRRLAASVSDPEEHARHAALGSLDTSSAVATSLDVAAAHARRRGSLDAAAELAQLALTRTPPEDQEGLLRRTTDAARYLYLLGDPVRARALLDIGSEQSPPGPHRVEALLLQAAIASWERGDATVVRWCEQALAEAGDDPLLQARVHAAFAATSPSGAFEDLFHAESAVALLETLPDPPSGLLASVLTNVACHRFRLGQGLQVDMLERAAALQAESEPVPVVDRAGMGLGMYLKAVDRFEESRGWLNAMRRCAIDEGDDSALPITLGHLAALECWAGDYVRAVDLAVEGREHAERMAIRAPMPTSVHVLALAHQGHLEKARELGAADLAADEAVGFTSATALDLRSLGTAELWAGEAVLAADHLLRALEISSDEVGIREPAILRVHPEAVSALVTLGRLEEALVLTEQLAESTEATQHPWSRSMALRCHALLAAAGGDNAGAVVLLDEALDVQKYLPMPFELARTRLLLGQVLRRAGRRKDSRGQLESARDLFQRLGTPVHEREADAELAAIGGRRRETDELTPVERRVAVLVAAGRTNREVATELFTSVRTVESHLGRIYRKLNLRSRTELAALLSA